MEKIILHNLIVEEIRGKRPTYFIFGMMISEIKNFNLVLEIKKREILRQNERREQKPKRLLMKSKRCKIGLPTLFGWAYNGQDSKWGHGGW